MTRSPRLILLLVAPFALVPLAGCFGSPGGAGLDGSSLAPSAPTAMAGGQAELDGAAYGAAPTPVNLPANLTRQETIVASVKPFGASQGGVCRGATSACYRTPFVVREPAAVDARLVWHEADNDLDMHVYRNGALYTSSAASGPGAAERIDTVLPPGTYDLVVVAWIAEADAFSLDVRFAPPPIEPVPVADTGADCASKPLLSVGPVSVGRTTCGSR